MRYRPDIAVYSTDGRPQLVVEVKGLVNKTPDWAAMLRHNLTGDLPPQRANYFILALPDRFYVWQNAQDPAPRRPDVELDTAEVLHRYMPRPESSRVGWRESELELSVAAWLDDLVRAGVAVPDVGWVRELARIGLLDSIRGGEVRVGAAA